MTVNEEKNALITIAMHQNALSIKNAQSEARSVLRDGAKRARQQLAEELKLAKESISTNLKDALCKSDSKIAANFKTEYELRYDSGVLGLDIAANDFHGGRDANF